MRLDQTYFLPERATALPKWKKSKIYQIFSAFNSLFFLGIHQDYSY